MRRSRRLRRGAARLDADHRLQDKVAVMMIKIVAAVSMVIWAASFILYTYNYVVMLGGVKQEKNGLYTILVR
jgi:hypothetical protein